MVNFDTIVALATAPGTGAIAVIRVSGTLAIEICDGLFKAKSNKKLSAQKSHTIHLGHIMDGPKHLDEVLVSIFQNSNSYTGEPTVEISCHGSSYIQQEIIQLLLRKGCRMANPGEFTLRAFLNGKLDLSQAEAVADLITSDSEASHKIAMQQMRGGFSNEIQELRSELVNVASLVELELDFAEEDVEFADRTQFKSLLTRISTVLKRLIDSFAIGNVIKNGIPIAIVGEPNVGKSTLLNALLNEDRAIVSSIAGTTRDTIEDELSIGGVNFRFIDTAGIRQTQDTVENIGIQKTFEKIKQAQVVIYLMEVFSGTDDTEQNAVQRLRVSVEKIRNQHPQKPILIVPNKIDRLTATEIETFQKRLATIDTTKTVLISAKQKIGIDTLKNELLNYVNTGALRNDETIITNSRHYDSLLRALEAISSVQKGLESGLSGDLLAIDIRQALHHFGEITGEISSDDLLGNIFANFCIGK